MQRCWKKSCAGPLDVQLVVVEREIDGHGAAYRGRPSAAGGDDHALHLRRAAGVVAERAPVDAVDLARPAAPTPRLDLPERAEDLHAPLSELGLELLGDRLVQVTPYRARALVPEQLLDLHADGEIGELHAHDGIVGEGPSVARGRPAVLHELVEHPRVAGGRRLVLLLGPGVVGSSKVGIGFPPMPEPDLLPALVEVTEHALVGTRKSSRNTRF